MPAATQPTTGPATTTPATEPAKTDEIAVSFKGMSVEQIGAFLSEKMGKPVLISEAIKSKKINIISKAKMPLKEAVHLIRQALLAEGVMVEELDGLIRIRPVSEAMQAQLPRVPAEKSLATIEDKLQIVAKEFLIRHYDVEKLVAVLKPMLPSFGYIVADPDTSKLVITDTVTNLLRIEKVIVGMDVPLAERTLTEIIEVEHGDAAEIIAIIRWLIAGRMGIHVQEITTATGEKEKARAGTPSGSRSSRSMPPGVSMRSGSSRSPTPSGGKAAAEAGVTQIEPSKTPVTLVPHVSRNWIIAVAPAEVMVQIRLWVKQLDKPREVEKDYEMYDVQHADVEDVARRIERTLQAMPNAELRETTHVVPFAHSEKLIVFGSKTGRQLVKDLLGKLDVESAQKRMRKTIVLKHADAEEMAQRIENLFSEMELSYSYDYDYYRGRSYRRDPDAAKVTVVPDKRRNAITIITDPKTMVQIEELVREEDKEVDPGDLRPKVYELRYVNAGEMQELLTDMFSARETSRASRYIFYDIFGGGSREREIKPVGRLLGQFTFQVVPSSNKLIVNTKSVANYKVIDELILELDKPQKAGLPLIVGLKFANAEDLCEQLNAILAESGTLAKIRRADRGLSDYHAAPSAAATGGAVSPGTAQDKAKQADPGEMPFWWQGFRPPRGEVPTSNLIGKIRIVPVYRQNALMVLAPEGYKEPIRELIEQLDQAGRQVVIRGRIGEIQHDDQTTLGLRIASDPSILPAADTAIGGSAVADYTDAFFGGTLVLGARANVSALLNMLIKEFDMKVKLEPAITTSDNKASEYFDGTDVPTRKGVTRSAEGTTTVTDVEYRQVGTRLRVRPHITEGGSVDLLINLEISRVVPGAGIEGNPTIDRREVTTHVIVKGGQTIMLSGIVRQEEFAEVHKVPLLGDIPLIGLLFRSIDKGVRNRELVVFITPYVMTTAEQIDAQMKEPLKTLQRIEESKLGSPNPRRGGESGGSGT